MMIEQAIYNFIVARRVENCSPRTLDWYNKTLHRFLRWLIAAHDVVEVTNLQLVHLREWISYLQETSSRYGTKHSDAYVAGCGRALLAFCRWMEIEGVIGIPISTRFKIPREEQKFIPTFTSDDIGRLFAACDSVDKRHVKLSKALAARNKAILSVFLDTGIRLKELVGLRLCDVDRDRRLLLVHRKGNWWQQVPISWDGFKLLHEYLTKYRPYLASRMSNEGVENIRSLAHKNDPVFLAYNGKPLTAGSIEGLFDTLEKRTGI